MTATVGWILNLDADLELAAADGGFRRSNRQREVSRERGSRFLEIANDAGALQHVDLERHGDAVDVCQAWSPTPFALRIAEERGAPLPAGPSLEVLRAVNHRSFVVELGCALPGAQFVRSMPALDAVLASESAGDGWLLKRPFGFSGRGRKHVRGDLHGADRRWAEASMIQYGIGLQVEPFVEIRAEFALHGYLARDGRCRTGLPARLHCHADGSWLGTRREAVDLDEAELAALRDAHARAADLLSGAGYFGPFATDAFQWTGGFQPLSEINARYTMGWFTGMAESQVEWLELLRPGTPHES